MNELATQARAVMTYSFVTLLRAHQLPFSLTIVGTICVGKDSLGGLALNSELFGTLCTGSLLVVWDAVGEVVGDWEGESAQ